MSHDLEDQLRAGGQKVAQGVFRVDARRALAKLREYRLAEPHHWVLEVLRAASSAKARSVDVETDSDDIIIRFDGKQFEPAVMKDLLAQALDSGGQGERRSARYLSLGIAGALGLNPKWIRVRSGEVALEVVPPDEVTVSASREQGTFVQVRKRFGWNMVKVALGGASPEERAIVERARRYGPTLSLNKRRVDREPIFEGGFIVCASFERDGLEIEVGVPAKGPWGKLVLDIDGVVVARRELDLPGRFVVAWARCDRMRRNASGSDVVDSDPEVKAVLAKVRELALEATAKMGVAIAEEKAKPIWRERYRDYALECAADGKLHREVRPLLARFPLIPGVWEEWFSADDFEREAKEGRPIYVALEKFPRGSYPTPIARLQSLELDPLVKLLPPGRRLADASKVVRARARAAQAKHRWLSSPIEERLVPDGSYLARASVSGPNLSGELGLVEKRDAGAFVRFLCQGRFIQQAEVGTLAPLRLRAVVNWQKDVPEKLWAEIPSDKIWSLALAAIDAAAEQAVLAGLVTDEARAGPRLEAHGHDLLARRANAGMSVAKLPPALKAAPLFELTSGAVVSLDALGPHKSWRYVTERTDATLLSGEPVLVLTPELRDALARLSPKRLENAQARFDQEREIRERISGPKQAARLKKVEVVVELEAEGLTGQVGIPRNHVGFGLALTLLRDGVELETTSLTATYEFANAIVECKDFVPNADWDTVVRDPTFERALAAVRVAEAKLGAAVVDQDPTPLDAMPAGHRRFLEHFLRKHLIGSEERSPAAQRVEAAPLFRTQRGSISLATIRERMKQGERVWSLQTEALAAPASMLVVLIQPGQGGLLEDLLGTKIADATDELIRRQRRERYLSRPVVEPPLPTGIALGGAVNEPGARGFIALAAGEDRGAAIEVLVCERLFGKERFAANLPLAGFVAVDEVDAADPVLPPEARAKVKAAIRAAELDILRRAIASPKAAASQRVALFALQYQVDRDLPPELRAALGQLPLFPCTDGQARSAQALDGLKRLLFVTRPIEGEPASKEPVVLAVEPELRRALARWGTSEDVTLALQRELDARAARSRVEPRKKIALTAQARWRRQFNQPDFEGEVAVVAANQGRLELLHQRKPLTAMVHALPGPLAAIVNCDNLSLNPLQDAVVADERYSGLLEKLFGEVEALLDRVGEECLTAGEAGRVELVPLAFWLLSRKRRGAPLLKVPLFQTTEDKLVSLDQLFKEHEQHKSVLWSERQGAPLNESRWVWRPREGEYLALAAVPKLKLRFKDVTASIQRAAEVRARQKVTELTAVGEPQETLSDARLHGPVALGPAPSKVLSVQLYRDQIPLEHFTTPHAVGAVARINSDRLVPNADWTRAHRNLHFKQLIATVEDAVERLVARKLEAKDGQWRRYADAALGWKRAPGGPLSKVMSQLELFTSLGGAPITVGAVHEEHARAGRILVAEAHLPPPKGRLVLAKSEQTLDLLRLLGLAPEDTSAQLQRSVELEAGRQQRRLASLEYQGDPLVRLALEAEGLRGELVLVGPGESAQLVLAKEGISICTHPLGDGLPIGAVVSFDRLEVNEDWTKADVPRALKEQLGGSVELLFAALAAKVVTLPASQKPQARDAALAFLHQQGVTTAAHLERMKGAAAALARVPLLLSEAGEWVSLGAVADQVLRRGWVSVFEASWLKRDTRDELVLRAATLREPWISALEKLFGPSCVERVNDVALWRKQRAERDPAPGTPEREGLKRLRKQLRLLRAGALGHVTPDELDDVKVRSEGAKSPIDYDPGRKLVLLDGSDPLIARALEEIPQRPERTFVLLAAIYGAVNRALERVTDANEAELLGALAAHVAANPKCLVPADPREI